MAEPQTNPNDHRVVTFRNSTDFTFTPEMGCMYDGRAIQGPKSALGENPFGGIDAGEQMVLPYHIANLLARNLAKVSMTKQAPSVDPAGIPTGVPLWDAQKLERLKASYITDLYMEQKPVTMSETDRLMAKVEEYKAMVDKLLPQQEAKVEEPVVDTSNMTTKTVSSTETYQDKAEVIAELTKRGIKFDARQNKSNLEKLLA